MIVAIFPIIRCVQKNCEVVESANIADVSVYEWIEQPVRHA